MSFHNEISDLRVVLRDNTFQRLEVLTRNREKRHQYREFLVEGFRAIERAITGGWRILSWVFSSERGLSPRAQELMKLVKGASSIDLSAPLLEEISQKVDTSELLALVEIPPDSIERVKKTVDNEIYVIFDRPQNPGNLGTNIRTCDALGVHAAFIIGHAVDLYAPEAVRASVGSLFALPILRKERWEEVVQEIGAISTVPPRVIGTSALAKKQIFDADLRGPLILLIGNEKLGLSRALKECCDECVVIPQSGSATSLNVSCAVSIVLYEALRQRRSIG